MNHSHSPNFNYFTSLAWILSLIKLSNWVFYLPQVERSHKYFSSCFFSNILSLDKSFLFICRLIILLKWMFGFCRLILSLEEEENLYNIDLIVSTLFVSLPNRSVSSAKRILVVMGVCVASFNVCRFSMCLSCLIKWDKAWVTNKNK